MLGSMFVGNADGMQLPFFCFIISSRLVDYNLKIFKSVELIH